MKETAAQWPAGYRFTLGGNGVADRDSSSSGAPLLLSIVLVCSWWPSTSRSSTP